MSEKLLPCPFCGYSVVSVVMGSNFRWVECDGCGASCGEVRLKEGDETDIIKEWNTRTGSKPIPSTGPLTYNMILDKIAEDEKMESNAKPYKYATADEWSKSVWKQNKSIKDIHPLDIFNAARELKETS